MIFIKSAYTPLFFLLLVALLFGAYKLTESPPTWIDEGMVTQLALNLERHGVIGLQTSPGNFVSGAYISVGFPVTLPLAGVLKLIGEGLLESRMLMVVWILLLVLLVYLYILKEFGIKSAVLAGLLVVTFAPLYGNGKNVLGEVPGLVFLFLFLLLLHRRTFFLAGLSLGLVVATKPIFILMLGALLFSFIWSRWRESKYLVSLKQFCSFGVGVFLPLVVWFFTQFYRPDSFVDIFSFYRNPYGIENVSRIMLENFLRVFSELSPFYTVFLFALWGISVIICEWKKNYRVSIMEKTAFIFCLAIFFFYLRTPGWYRYFFPAQIVILAFLPQALFFLESYFFSARRQVLRFSILMFLLGLAVFQAYQTGFNSFVASYYDSTRTKDLREYFRNWNPEKSIFVYNAPEVVIFLPGETPYYQFLEINKGRAIGQAELDRVSHERIAHVVILSLDEGGKYPEALLGGYTVKDKVNRYLILEAKP